MKSAVVWPHGSGLPAMSVSTPCLSVGTSNVANRVSIWMPVTMFVLTPVPFERDVEHDRAQAVRIRRHAGTVAGRCSTASARSPPAARRRPTPPGGTRAPVAVARSRRYSSPMQSALSEVWMRRDADDARADVRERGLRSARASARTVATGAGVCG